MRRSRETVDRYCCYRAESGCGIMVLIDKTVRGGEREKRRKKLSGARLHAQEPGDGGQVLLLKHCGRVAGHGAALRQLHGRRHDPAAADAAQRAHAVQCVVAARHHAPQIACTPHAATLGPTSSKRYRTE